MKFLALDLSTNTGYAIFDNNKLAGHDTFTIKAKDYVASIKNYENFPASYPYNLIETSEAIANKCFEIFQENKCEAVVIEHPETSRQRISQRLIEFIHYAVLKKFEGKCVKYLLVSDWRRQVKCYIKHWPELKKWNDKVMKAKKIATPTKSGARLAKIGGKVVSKYDFKKLSIYIANKYYGVNISSDDVADAINIGRAACELGVFN